MQVHSAAIIPFTHQAVSLNLHFLHKEYLQKKLPCQSTCTEYECTAKGSNFLRNSSQPILCDQTNSDIGKTQGLNIQIHSYTSNTLPITSVHLSFFIKRPFVAHNTKLQFRNATHHTASTQGQFSNFHNRILQQTNKN
jgi:hypothetical protein